MTVRPVPPPRSFKRRSLAAGLALLLCFATPARAADERDYALPSGPLGTALARVAAEAGLLFSADARLVEGLSAPALQGRLAPREALARLLAGSGLELVEEAGGRLTLRRVAARPPVALPRFSVRASVLDAEDAADAGYRAESARSPARIDTPLADLPQSVSVITGELMQDLAPLSIADLLRYVPGVGAAQGEGNRDTPVFRGTASTSDFLIDGIRDDMQYYRDLYNIERVETLRGPNAMAVGHGAVGGLINRVSKQPGWTTRRELLLQAGTGPQRRATLDWNQAWSPQWAARLNALYEESDSYRQFFHLRRTGINPVLGWRPTADATLTLGFEHFNDQRTADRGVPSYRGRPLDTEPETFFGNPDASLTWIRLNAVNAQIDLDLGQGRSLRNRSRYASYDKFFQNVFPGSVREAGSGLEVALLAHNSRMRRHNAFNQTDLTLPFVLGDVRHTVLTGIELGRQAGDNRRETGYFGTDPPGTVIYVPVTDPVSLLPLNFRTSATDPDNSSTARIAALYLQDQIRLSPQWQATLGLRHDRLRLDVADRQQGQNLASRDRLWSPRAGLLYRPAPGLSAYANYSVGHAPRAGEQLNLLSSSNQALEPEHFTNRELGLRWTPRPRLEASLALYWLDRRNVAMADAAMQNLILVDGQRTRGLELGLSGELRPGWQLMGAYTLQDSRVRTTLSAAAQAGAQMPHVARHTLALWNRLALDSQWALGLGLSGRSSVFTSTDNLVRLPGYARVDGALFYAPRPGLRWQLNVENLFDRRYAAFAHSNNNITPGSPLALRGGLSAEF